MDGLSRGQLRPCPVNLHLEVALDYVDRLGLVVMSVSRQRPARWRMVDEQAERAASVIGDEVDLCANATGHPHDARIGCPGGTITAGPYPEEQG